MMDKATMDWIATSTDARAEQIRTAFQPLVDAFVRIGAEWNIPPPPDHRHMMRKKVRRCYR